MDTAVALVQCYLNVNGYFTVAEYPVLEASRRGPVRAVTDLDILGFRFPGAGHEIIRNQHHLPLAGAQFLPDRLLGCPGDRPDMIVGEVKEGPPGSTRPPGTPSCWRSRSRGSAAVSLLGRATSPGVSSPAGR